MFAVLDCQGDCAQYHDWPPNLGYLAIAMARVDMEGVTSIPTHISTGYIVMTRDNVDKPDVSKLIYTKKAVL